MKEDSDYTTKRVRIIPDSKQKLIIDKTINGYNFVYNECIEENLRIYNRIKNGDKESKTMTRQSCFNKYLNQLKQDNPSLYECDSRSLQGALKELEQSYKAVDFWHRYKHPDKIDGDEYTFYFSKSKSGKGSDCVTIDWDNDSKVKGVLKLPKIGKVICSGLRFDINRDKLKKVIVKKLKNYYEVVFIIKIR